MQPTFGIPQAEAAGMQATLTTSALTVGDHTITANYSGDITTNLAPSSATLSQTITQAATTTALTSSSNPSASGMAVTFTATVASPVGTPTGSVTFTSDTTTLGTVALTGGQATLTTSALTIGDHTVTVSYTGDANFQASNVTMTQTIIPPVEGLADPQLSPLMNALSNTITDSSGNKIIGLAPPCAMTGPYQGLSDIDKLNYSTQANDGCLQFVTTFTGP